MMKALAQLIVGVFISTFLSQVVFAEHVEFIDEKIAKQKEAAGEKVGSGTSGLYLEPAIGFGQSYSTEGGNPGLAYTLGGELGYMSQITSWRRLEGGVEFMMGKIGYKKDGTSFNMPIKYGLLAKLGYAHSLGHDMYGIWKLGAGVLGADLDAEADDYKMRAKDGMSGIAAQIGFSLHLPLGDTFLANMGAKWTHMTLDPGTVETKGPTTSNEWVETKDTDSTGFNVLEIRIGMRLII